MLKKIVVKNWSLSKIAFISFRGSMLKSKNLKMGTSSKAQFTLTVRTVTVYIAKANVLMGILFILLYQGSLNISNLTEIDCFFLWWIELTLRTKISEC